MRRFRQAGTGLGRLSVLLVVLGTAAAAAEDAAPQLSPAQVALFESNHLAGIRGPETLSYEFRHEDDAAKSFTDRVTLEIRSVRSDGRKDIAVAFLSGKREMTFPPVSGFNGNPVLMYFLEHDVVGMHDALGGSASYFRNRIRRAFVDRAALHPVTFMFDGSQRSGTEIDLQPFVGDPQIARFPGFADKSYRFILSDSVPGTIYEISATVARSDGKPPVEDTMTFAGERQ